MSILEVRNINKSFEKKKILEDVSLSVDKGEIVSIIGPSGVGKSTLLRCICGLENIDSGEIFINNKNRINNVGLEVGIVFQEYNLFPQYSVLENVTLPLRKVLKINKCESENIAIDLLKKLKLYEKISQYPFQLSGGEKQRLAIARTLAVNPSVICFDEPTSALDPKLINQIYKIIKDLACSGKAILIVTHDISFAKKISNKIIEF